MKRGSGRASIFHGFTLIELLVVMMVVVVAAGVVTPRIFGSLANTRLRSETQRLLAALQYCQGMAALQRTRYRFHFNLDEQSYYVTRDPSQGDDFELQGSGTLRDAEGYGSSSLFAGITERNKNEASNDTGRVDIFDSEVHFLPRNVLIAKIVDMRGEEIWNGVYCLVLDPSGTATATAIYLTTDRGQDTTYVVSIGANGIIEVYRQ